MTTEKRTRTEGLYLALLLCGSVLCLLIGLSHAGPAQIQATTAPQLSDYQTEPNDRILSIRLERLEKARWGAARLVVTMENGDTYSFGGQKDD